MLVSRSWQKDFPRFKKVSAEARARMVQAMVCHGLPVWYIRTTTLGNPTARRGAATSQTIDSGRRKK